MGHTWGCFVHLHCGHPNGGEGGDPKGRGRSAPSPVGFLCPGWKAEAAAPVSIPTSQIWWGGTKHSVHFPLELLIAEGTAGEGGLASQHCWQQEREASPPSSSKKKK